MIDLTEKLEISRRVERLIQILSMNHSRLGLTAQALYKQTNKVRTEKEAKKTSFQTKPGKQKKEDEIDEPWAKIRMNARRTYERALGLITTESPNAKAKLGAFVETRNRQLHKTPINWRLWQFATNPTGTWQLRDIRIIYSSLQDLKVVHHAAIELQSTVESWITCLENLIEQIESRLDNPVSPTSFGVAAKSASDTSRYFRYYLGNRHGEVPFGGRNGEMEALTKWLNEDTAPSRLLLTAEAGRGKSALLLEWLRHLRQSQTSDHQWQFAFTPISKRSGTNHDIKYYKCFAERLAEIKGTDFCIDGQHTAVFYRDTALELIESLSGENKHVLIVIDGLDEALGNGFDPEILKFTLPSNIRILVSARLQAFETSPDNWATKLGWDRDVPHVTMEIGQLNKEAIVDILRKLGGQISKIARDQPLMDELERVINGEPLAARFYAEDLVKQSRKILQINLAALKTVGAGFNGYFEKWLDSHHYLSDMEPLEIRYILSILSYSYGPLQSSDLVELCRVIFKHEIGSEVEVILKVKRFVLGDGSPKHGYVIAHPLIEQFLQSKRYQGNVRTIQLGLSRWCENYLRDLNDEKTSPPQVPSYVVRFSRQHLLDSKYDPKFLMEMTSEKWRLAWECVDQHLIGYASDILAVFNVISLLPDTVWLVEKWRCVLRLSSIRGQASRISHEMVIAAFKKGFLSTEEVTFYIDALILDHEAVEAYAIMALIVLPNYSKSIEFTEAAVQRLRRSAKYPGILLFRQFLNCIEPLISTQHISKNFVSKAAYESTHDYMCLALGSPKDFKLRILDIILSLAETLLFPIDEETKTQINRHVENLSSTRTLTKPTGHFRNKVKCNNEDNYVDEHKHGDNFALSSMYFTKKTEAQIPRNRSNHSTKEKPFLTSIDWLKKAFTQDRIRNDRDELFEVCATMLKNVDREKRYSTVSLMLSRVAAETIDRSTLNLLIQLVPLLSKDQISVVETAIDRLPNINSKIQVLVNLLPIVVESEQIRILQKLGTIKPSWLDEFNILPIQNRVSSSLGDVLLPLIDKERDPIRNLHLKCMLLNENDKIYHDKLIIVIIRQLQDIDKRFFHFASDVLYFISSRLSATQVAGFVKQAEQIEDLASQYYAILATVSHVFDDQADVVRINVFKGVQKLEPIASYRLLLQLAVQSRGSDRVEIVHFALKTISKIKDHYDFSACLLILIPVSTSHQLDTIIKFSSSVANHSKRATIVARAANYLPATRYEDLFRKAISVLHSSGSMQVIVQTYCKLLEFVPTSYRNELTQGALSIIESHEHSIVSREEIAQLYHFAGSEKRNETVARIVQVASRCERATALRYMAGQSQALYDAGGDEAILTVVNLALEDADRYP